MLLRQTEFLVAVADCGSIEGASKALGVPQKAVSEQLAALEKELGVQLFTGAPGRLMLLPAGEYLYAEGKKLISRAEEVKKQAGSALSADKFKLTVGYLSAYDGQELAAAILEFSRRFPEVSVSAFKGTHEQLRGALESGGADIIVCDGRRAYTVRYESFPLVSSPAYIDALPAVLAGVDCITLARIKPLPCIVVAPEGGEEDEQDFYREVLGIESRFVFARSLEEARLLAMSGDGYLPAEGVCSECPPPLERAELRRADGTKIIRSFSAFWMKDGKYGYKRAFADVLRSAVCE